MNQILVTQNIQSKSKGRNSRRTPSDIDSIIRFFAVVLIIFGIFLVASSSYAMYKSGSSTAEVSTKKPEIQVETKNGSEDELLLTVMHDKTISKVIYYWNDGEEEEITGGKTYLQEVIEIPAGENTLHIIATDVNGQKSEFSRIYESSTQPTSEDSTITSNITMDGESIKIELESETEISYMTYKWDDEEEIKLQVNDFKFETKLDVEKGEHKLIIYAVDVDGNELNKEQDVTGTEKPKITLEKGDDCYIIKVTDETALSKVVIKRLDDGKEFPIDVEDKEFEYKFPLITGENKIEITAYNIYNASSTVKAKWVKE